MIYKAENHMYTNISILHRNCKCYTNVTEKKSTSVINDEYIFTIIKDKLVVLFCFNFHQKTKSFNVSDEN